MEIFLESDFGVEEAVNDKQVAQPQERFFEHGDVRGCTATKSQNQMWSGVECERGEIDWQRRRSNLLNDKKNMNE